MSNCINCNKEIESKGTKPSKYCSDKCRKVYVRANGQTKLEQTDKIEAKTEQTDRTNGQTDRTIEQTDSAVEQTDKCTCQHCKQLEVNKIDVVLNHGPYLNAEQLAYNGYDYNRVSLPGDIDYQRSYV